MAEELTIYTIPTCDTVGDKNLLGVFLQVSVIRYFWYTVVRKILHKILSARWNPKCLVVSSQVALWQIYFNLFVNSFMHPQKK